VAWELADLDSAVVVAVFRVRLDVLAEGELEPRPMSDKAVVIPETWDGPGLDMGWATLVERYMISFPWTTRLSLDFLRSKVSISIRTSFD
jgi:hypothetical protein